MTPGEAAVMKASAGVAPARAERRFPTSRSTAVRSFHSMGPLHDGRATTERRRRGRRPPENLPSRTGGASPLPPNPVRRWRT